MITSEQKTKISGLIAAIRDNEFHALDEGDMQTEQECQEFLQGMKSTLEILGLASLFFNADT